MKSVIVPQTVRAIVLNAPGAARSATHADAGPGNYSSSCPRRGVCSALICTSWNSELAQPKLP